MCKELVRRYAGCRNAARECQCLFAQGRIASGQCGCSGYVCGDVICESGMPHRAPMFMAGETGCFPPSCLFPSLLCDF